MSAFDKILAELAALRAKVEEQRTTLTLGTYQADGTVLLTDGAEVTPAATLAIVGTGDKVLLAQHNRRAYIVGQASPTTTSYSLGSLSDVDTTGASTGDHLVFDGTQWGPVTPAAGPTPTVRMQAGQASALCYAETTIAVTFPTVFAAAPRVFCQLASDPGDRRVWISTESVTASGFTMRIFHDANPGGVSRTFHWLAIPDGALTL